jgi:hypothetical protein
VAKEKLAPLAADPSGKLQPLSLTQNAGTPAAEPVAPEEKPDPVQAWVKENENFDENAPAVTPSSDVPVVEKKPEEKPVVAGTPSEPKPADPAAPVIATKPGEAAPVVAVDPNAAPIAAVPAKPTYEADEKFALAEGSEWTRAQIVAGLTERHKLQESAKQFEPVKAEADGYKQLFGMPLEQAKTAWGPILKRLTDEPQTAQFLDEYLQDDGLADYLNECATYYAGQNPQAQRRDNAGARQPQKPAVDPEMARQVRELNEWKATQEKERAEQRVQSEWQQATTRYPFLAHDHAARQDLVATAQWMNAQDPSKGILDALALKAPIYDKLGVISPAAAPVAQPVVPALLGSPGASPTASRAPQSNRPKRFDLRDESAVEDWLKNPPAQFAQ